ncbi:MAG: OmpH family outer membrane protein [Gammaproteobacteria bacterium]|nr:OmpH family outer membrane protein [Gammaproteobacteria bacterium]MBT8075277.1 OmpH family outer membrane protein [Gammaproteobacteria bacterium]NNK98117.1 OmpH family outer membrane protein [Xanthomonadales bacterium]
MKRFLPTVVLFLMVVASPAMAQQLRIGYVDMKQVLDNAPQVLAGREKLDLEFRPRNETIEFQERQVQAMDDRLQLGDLTEDARIRLERELREMRRNVNRQKEDLRDELSFRRTEEVQKLEDQINLAVQQIARENGYDLILSSPVIYADPSLDITGLILDQLRLEYEADKRENSLR